MKNEGFISDPRLLPRIKEHCRNFPSQTYQAERIAYDLQQKYIEYSRKQFKPFVRLVNDGLEKLRIEAKPSPIDVEVIDDDAGGSDGDVVPIDVVPTDAPTETPAKNSARKRKAERVSTPKKSTIFDDDAIDKEFDAFKGNNRANKGLLNMYAKNQSKTPQLTLNVSATSKTESSKKNKPASGSGEKTPSAPRGLGSVATFNISPRASTVRFNDLGGCDRQFLEVCRLVMHLKRPKTYGLLGVDPPKGFIIHGPPGCGKTLFAQAVAGEFDLPLLHLAATELISGVSGETEEKIRQLFTIAKANAPCVLILDEIDAIAPRRETATREMERRIVSQLSNSLDDLFGMKDDKPLKDRLDFTADGEVSIIDDSAELKGHVLVIGTTSRPDAVDGGLRRAGRFDCEIALGIPDEAARLKILSTVCKLPVDENVSMLNIARLTPGYVGADLNALVREAAKCAINRIFDTIVNRNSTKRQMTNAEVKEELDKVLIWLNGDDDPSVVEGLGGFHVVMNDFERALENVQPSAKREGFATVPDVTWNDIGALSDVRLELEWSILYPVKRPEDFALLGISSKPQGILLCGPPGCGKTLLAKAVANETGMNFISVKGPELLNMYVGESERAVRTVFQRARDSSPCVIFFDEIDALCPKRSNNESSGSSRLVNQLLTEMDGVEGRKQVFLIGATNRPDIVDAAILRPGRLDKILFVDFPNSSDRADILRKSTKGGTNPKISNEVNFDEIGCLPQLDGFTGADLAAIVHEASIIALKERLFKKDTSVDSVNTSHFLEAIQRIRPSVTEADRKKYSRMREIYSKKSAVVNS